MRTPFAFGKSTTEDLQSAESVVSINQVLGGRTSTLQTLGQVLPLMTESELLLVGFTPAFARFVTNIKGLSWHVAYTASVLDSPPRPLLAMCLHSAANTIELVLDPASSFARQCIARWQRQGYADVVMSKDGNSIACTHRVSVRSLNAELATWPIQAGWPVNSAERMCEVITYFENSASDCGDTVQMAVIEVSDDTEPSRPIRLPELLDFRAEATSQRARSNQIARMFGHRVRH